VLHGKYVVALPCIFKNLKPDLFTMLKSVGFKVLALGHAEARIEEIVCDLVIHLRKRMTVGTVPIEPLTHHGLRVVGVMSQCLLATDPTNLGVQE
jgi:hypothetical protein